MHASFLQLLALRAYQIALSIAFPVGALLFLPFILFIKKRRATLLKRFGWQRYPHAPNHEAGPIWVHTLSVGELLSAATLIKTTHATIKDRPLYLSVSTLSGFTLAREKLSEDIDGIFYFPYDAMFAVRRCLNHITPGLFILVETDIWPGFLKELRRRRIPGFLVNGRLSPESYRSYNLLRWLFKPALNTFTRVYPQSQREAERFLTLGVDAGKIHRCGNLKFDVTDSLPSQTAGQELRDALKLRSDAQILVAGSTHQGEEALLRSVYIRLRESHPSLTLILAPRHPDRSAALLSLFEGDPFQAGLFSQGPALNPGVMLVDQMGYLSRLYALADVAFVGGSLVPQGGHNPIEPASYGKPVLFGPDMRDFPDVSTWLLETGGAIQVKDEHELYEHCQKLLSDTALAQAMGRKAQGVVEANRGTTGQIVEDIQQFLAAGRP